MQITPGEKCHLIDGCLIRLKHYNTGAYLMSDKIHLQQKEGIFKNLSVFGKKVLMQVQNKDEKYFFIVGGIVQPEITTLWIVNRVIPQSDIEQSVNFYNSDIWFDDFITLQNYITGQFLTSKKDIKSQTTQQGMVCCQTKETYDETQIFMIQRIYDEYSVIRKPQEKIDNNIYSRQQVMIIGLDSNVSLHSHSNNYRQENAVLLQEITLFDRRDDNDYWQMLIYNKDDLHQEQKVQLLVEIPRTYQYIHHIDKIIIRNCKYGGSLHSHNRQYQSGSYKQEVTWKYFVQRDVNDWWEIDINKNESVIVQTQDELYENKIKMKCHVSLKHVQTQQYMTHFKGFKSPSGLVYEVTCLDKPRHSEWLLIGLIQFLYIQALEIKAGDVGSYLPTEYPFLLKHLPTNTYLTCYKVKSNPTTSQYQVGLQEQFSANSVWQVEQKNSIFA